MWSCTRDVGFALGVILVGIAAAAAEPGESSFAPVSNVAPRRDTSGNILDAHDGCLHKFGDRYYLYGTAYGKTDGFGKSNRYCCYSSVDLIAWKPEGELLAKPPEGVYYRPYVVYNAKTRKYVLWYNWYPTLWNGQYGVATSDTPQGPFVLHNPNDPVSQPRPGDLGLFVDDDGTGYIIYTSIAKNHGISIEKLTDDYLGSTQENSGLLASGCEAPVLLKRQGTYYALFDNCCCFCPGGTGARVYTAAKPLGPYTWKGKLNINRDAKGTPIIHAQQTHVAQLPTPAGVDYVWMGDRWGSTPDRIKGHDFQYWAPLTFSRDGDIMPLKWTDEWTIGLAESRKAPPTGRPTEPAFLPVEDLPGLPRVLLLGDSISIGYTVEVRELLKGKANVFRPSENCGDTRRGLAMLDKWLGEKKWDVIHFNFGLHDLKYLNEKGEYVTPDRGKQVAPLPQYEQNLRQLVQRLRKTGARLIWCSTTPVPEGARGRVKDSETAYNALAAKIAAEYGVAIDDLHAVAKARQAAIQNPKDVHFTAEGSKILAKAVAESIQHALGR